MHPRRATCASRPLAPPSRCCTECTFCFAHAAGLLDAIAHRTNCHAPPQGYLGQPSFGFPEPLRSRVLKGKPIIEGRPGASMAEMDLVGLEARLKDKWGRNISKRDVLSSAMYPQASGLAWLGWFCD